MTASKKKQGKAAEVANAQVCARASAAVLPPSTNRGVTMTIDYLSITAFTNLSQLAYLVIEHLLGDESAHNNDWSEYFFKRDISARGYRVLYSGPEGMTIYAYPHDGVHCHLEMKGKTLEAIDNSKLSTFINELNECDFKWRPSRIDIAFDHVSFTPEMCWQHYQRGAFKSRANRNSGEWRKNDLGATFYMGSRQSGRYLRVYDMRGYTRVEIVFKKEYAIALKDDLSTQINLMNNALGYLRSYIEFTTEAIDKKNSSRVEITDWWQSLVGNVDKINLNSKPSSERFLRQKTERYFERILPSLCIISEGLNIDVNKKIKGRLKTLKSNHLTKIKTLRESR